MLQGKSREIAPERIKKISQKGNDTHLWMCLAMKVKSDDVKNSIKRQKDRTLKYELPRSVGAQNATGDQWRNRSRKKEETEPKQKQHPVVDVTGDGSKVRCCEE